jgi:hypothetical protein
MPSIDEIVRFESELGCPRLKPQVRRLFESIATTRPAAEAKPEEPRKEPLPALALTREQPVVGVASRNRARGDGTAGAAAVIHHDLLANRPAHLLGDHATQRVVAAAGRKRNDERHRPGGVCLGGGRAGCE